MPSSCKVIRGEEIQPRELYMLEVRHEFPVMRQEGSPDSRTAEEKLASALEEAEKIIEKAHKEAAEILAGARRKGEENAAELAETARRVGFQQGYEEAMQKAAQAAEVIRTQAADVLTQAQEVYQSTIDSMQDEIIALAEEIAERIVFTQLTLTPEAVVKVAKESLDLARAREQVVLYVNPVEEKLYHEHKEDLKKVIPPAAVLYIITDERITPGGCVVQTPDSRVDATIESRIKAMKDVLYGVED